MSTWLTNCRLIDGIANRPAVDMAIEICGSKIGRILQSSALETEDVIGADDQIIDCLLYTSRCV